MKKIFNLLMLLMISVCSVMAGTTWEHIDKIKPTTATVNYEATEGRFRIKFNYYYNPTNSSKDVSLTGDSYIQANIAGIGDITIMKLRG